MKVRQYRPGFFDCDTEPEEAVVTNISEIHDILWLQRHGPLEIEDRYVTKKGTPYVVALIEE